ncbi:MAG TPA: DegV family protein [Ktedonobacteraceae bacterium]|jgi:DegV family protein with EDD domain|nr:DegV family protein [Ktedonobacteraceae bacterium]
MVVHILTDSTADIPRERAEALGITVVPLTVFFGDAAYLDGIELDNTAFYARLQSSKVSPRTSQPSPAAFLEAYTKLIHEGADAILAVMVSAKLSGTYQSACTARDSLPDDLKKIPIDIVDSESVSIGMNMAIMHAAEEAQQGSGLEEIKANLLDRLARTRVLFVLDTLEYLKRGGRIGGAVALVGAMLSVKPILTIKNGLIDLIERPRTRSKAYARIAQLIGEMAQPEEFAIVESDTAVGQQLTQALQESHTGTIPTYKLGAVVGTYTGPGTAGVAFITQPS